MVTGMIENIKEIAKHALDIYLSKKLWKQKLAEGSQMVKTIKLSDDEVNEIKNMVSARRVIMTKKTLF